MIWECPCGHSINIPTKFFFHLSIGELDYRCSEKFNNVSGATLNPWTHSVLAEGEQENKSYDELEEEDDQEEEDLWVDTDMSLSGYDDY